MASSYKAEKQSYRRAAGRSGDSSGCRGLWGRVQLSLPHVTHVPVLVELVEVVSIPGEKAEAR